MEIVEDLLGVAIAGDLLSKRWRIRWRAKALRIRNSRSAVAVLWRIWLAK